MSFSHRTNVNISPEDKKLLDDRDIGYSEAIKKFCHELRLADSLFLSRGLQEAKEKIENMGIQRQKWIDAARGAMDEEQFNKFLENI